MRPSLLLAPQPDRIAARLRERLQRILTATAAFDEIRHAVAQEFKARVFANDLHAGGWSGAAG